MSTCMERTRTNLFAVTDVEKFKEIVAKMKGSDKIELIREGTEDSPVFALGCYGSIDGYESDNPMYCEDFDAMAEDLQTILPDGEAIIFTSAYFEKLSSVGGYVTVITNKDVKYTNLADVAKSLASEMLGEEFVIVE